MDATKRDERYPRTAGSVACDEPGTGRRWVTRCFAGGAPWSFVGTSARQRRSNYKGKEFVEFTTTLAAGSIIIRTSERKLYYVLPDGRAIKYGIGVGREGFTWSGTDKITRKAEWPAWAIGSSFPSRRRSQAAT